MARGVAGILDADPSRGVDRAVVIDERHPRVVGLNVLGYATVGHDDHAAARIVRAALGRIDRAVDLDVRRHRFKGSVRGRIDRQPEAVADEKRLRRLRRLLCEQCACGHANRQCSRARQPGGSFHVTLSSNVVRGY